MEAAGAPLRTRLWLVFSRIKQANEGCDFDFLETEFGKPVGEPSIVNPVIPGREAGPESPRLFPDAQLRIGVWSFGPSRNDR